MIRFILGLAQTLNALHWIGWITMPETVTRRLKLGVAAMTDEEVMVELRSSSRLNRARKEFSSAAARIEQAGQQRKPLSSIDMRRMEFEAVKNIVAAWEGIADD